MSVCYTCSAAPNLYLHIWGIPSPKLEILRDAGCSHTTHMGTDADVGLSSHVNSIKPSNPLTTLPRLTSPFQFPHFLWTILFNISQEKDRQWLLPCTHLSVSAPAFPSHHCLWLMSPSHLRFICELTFYHSSLLCERIPLTFLYFFLFLSIGFSPEE